MKIILTADLDGVGNKGDVLDVSDGYAMNFLIPKGFGLRATAGAERQATEMRRAREIKDAAIKGEAETIATRVVGNTVTIAAKAGDGGKLFGSVTTSDVADAVSHMFNVTLDRKILSIDEPIKELGSYTVTAKPHPQVTFPISVDVVAD